MNLTDRITSYGWYGTELFCERFLAGVREQSIPSLPLRMRCKRGLMITMADQEQIVVRTSRFGDIAVEPSEVITIVGGLLGFSGLNRFVLINNPEQAPFMWFQCLDDGDLAFVVVDPFVFFPGYKIHAKREDLEPIGLNSVKEATILTIVTIPLNPQDMTTNLRGPLVFNVESRLGKQMVLIDDRYHTKHYLLHDIPEELAGASRTASEA